MDRPEIARLLSEARVRHSPLMSPLVWGLGHIAHFEDLWLLENIGPDPDGRQFGEVPGMYDPFENPRSVRGAAGGPAAPGSCATRDHGSDEGWSWREDEGAEAPLYWRREGRAWHTRARRQIFSGFRCAR